MGVFEHFPYTNFHELNLDWLLESMRQLADDMENYDANMQQFVDQWMADHPEVTTTVQDGSLTIEKFTDELKAEVEKDYITPQMFGAVGDGVADDATALQAALNAAQAQSKPLALISDYYCNSNLTVPSYIRVFGLSQNTERKPFIYAGAAVTTLFTMPGIINRFDNFGVMNLNNTYRANTLFDFQGNSSHDVDSTMNGVIMGYAGIAVLVRGRNVELDGCLMSHCGYGVYYDLPNAQMRGLTIKNCSFHGIGEELALNWFENSACVYIENDFNANLLIENCHSEQSGTFFKGRCTQALIVGNFVESYKATIVEITASPTNTLGNAGCMMFVGNSFNGKHGSVASGVSVNYPEHHVTITNNGRIVFLSNLFRMCGGSPVVMSTAFRCSFCGNHFVSIGLDNSDYNAFTITTATNCVIMDNVAVDSGIVLYSSQSTGSLKIRNNACFSFPSTSSGVVFIRDKQLYPVGNINGSSPITSFTLPDDAVFQRVGTDQLYRIHKYGNAYTSAICVTSPSEWFVLYIDTTGSDPVPYLRRYLLSSGSLSTTLYTSLLTVYQEVNE